jgi:hypothetical protein
MEKMGGRGGGEAQGVAGPTKIFCVKKNLATLVIFHKSM